MCSRFPVPPAVRRYCAHLLFHFSFFLGDAHILDRFIIKKIKQGNITPQRTQQTSMGPFALVFVVIFLGLSINNIELYYRK